MPRPVLLANGKKFFGYAFEHSASSIVCASHVMHRNLDKIDANSIIEKTAVLPLPWV
jgi:hypothetical protein